MVKANNEVYEKSTTCSAIWFDGFTKIFTLFCGQTDEVFNWGVKNSDPLLYAGRQLYSKLVSNKEIEPIESLPEETKLKIWNQAKELRQDKQGRINASLSFYLRGLVG